MYIVRRVFSLFFILLIACSEDDTMNPDDGTNPNQGSDLEICQPTGTDYVLKFTLGPASNTQGTLQLLLLDNALQAVREETLTWGQEKTVTISGAGQQTFTVLIKSAKPAIDTYNALLLLDLPQGSYTIPDENFIFGQQQQDDFRVVDFDIINMGSMPFLLRNWNYYLNENNYNPNSGGTYDFGTGDDYQARKFYPALKGFYITLRSGQEGNDRYYWSASPPTVSNPGTVDFQQLPFVDRTISLTIDNDILNSVRYNYSLFGFVPENTNKAFGNLLGSFNSDFTPGEGTVYSIPDGLFDRYRYQLRYELPGATVRFQKNQNEPVINLSKAPFSIQVQNDWLSDYRANATGEYDAIQIRYQTFEEKPSGVLYQNLSIYGPQQSSYITKNFFRIISDHFPEMSTGALRYDGTWLYRTSGSDCYAQFVKNRLEDRFLQFEEYIEYNSEP